MQGRTLDLANCLVSGSGVLLIVSPTRTSQLAERLQKYILFGDEVAPKWLCNLALPPRFTLNPVFWYRLAGASLYRMFNCDPPSGLRSRDATLWSTAFPNGVFDEQVTVTDVSSRTAMFSLIGPESAALLEQLGLDTEQLEQHQEQPRRHMLLNFSGKPVIVAAGSGLASPGFTLISDESVAGELWTALTAKV